MTALRVQTVDATVSSTGTVTLVFPQVPGGLVWTGTVAVPLANQSGIWTAKVGTSTDGTPIGSWGGSAPYGPIQVRSAEVLTISGVGATAGAIVRAIFIGTNDREGEEPVSWPAPIPSSVVVNTYVGAYTKIADQEVTIAGAGAALSFDFTGIDQSYRSLELIVVARGTNANPTIVATTIFNGDSSALYDYQELQTLNAALSQTTQTAGTDVFGSRLTFASNGVAAGWAGSLLMRIPGYRSSAFFKNFEAENNIFSGAVPATDFLTRRWTGLYRSLNPISRITIVPVAANFAVGSFATLYGLQ